MSYEVYIDVRHHPRHLDDFERKLTTADRWVEPEGADPSDAERMRAVCRSLRGLADLHDPDARCSNCSALRHEHYGFPAALVRCHNQYGPIAQSRWWSLPERSEGSMSRVRGED